MTIEGQKMYQVMRINAGLLSIMVPIILAPEILGNHNINSDAILLLKTIVN